MRNVTAPVLLTVWLASAIAAPTQAQDTSTTAPAAALHAEDQAYLLQAIAANAAQLAVNEVAIEKAQDDVVRRFAQDLSAHYRAAQERLTSLAQGYGIEPVTSLDPVTERLMETLATASGEAFDAAYVAGQVVPIYTEEWVHRRAAEHATVPDLRQTARAAVGPTHERYERALELALRTESDLPEGLHPWDRDALTFGMDIDLAQVALGELAVERAQDERVRAFAERMVEDHGGSFETFADLAREHGVTPLETPGPLKVAVLEALQALPDAEFDLAYLRSQVIFHDNWYKRIEYVGHNGRDEAVERLAHAGHEVGMAHHDAVYAIVRGWGG